ALAAGDAFACALRTDRSVWCWGDNAYTQAGNAAVAGTPVAIAGLDADIVEIAAGATHACARGHAGRVVCWGDTRFGKLGVAPSPPRPTPAQVPVISAMAQIAVGADLTCARTPAPGGVVWCWGDNSLGELGSAAIDEHGPIAVAVAAPAIAVGAGSSFAC